MSFVSGLVTESGFCLGLQSQLIVINFRVGTLHLLWTYELFGDTDMGRHLCQSESETDLLLGNVRLWLARWLSGTCTL